MKKLIALAIIATFPSAQEPDSHRQKVVDRLKAVMAAFAKAESVAYEVETSKRQENNTNPPLVSRSRVTLRRPNLGRIESGERGGLRIADGKEMWSGSRSSYSKNRQNQSTFTRYFEADFLASRLFFLKDPADLLKRQGDFGVEKGRIGKDSYAILCWKGISGYGSVTETRLWIDDGNLPRRVERKWERPSMMGGGYMVVVETDEISKLELNPTPAADAFKFTPAEGAAEMDLIEVNSHGNLPVGADEPTAVLEGVRASLKAAESIDYSVEIRVVGDKVDPKSQPMRRRVRAQRPGFIRIDETSPVTDKSIIVDGEWTWTLDRHKKTYLRTWLLDPYLSAGPENDPWFRLFWERRPTRVFARGKDVKLTREKFGDADCRKIEWTRTDAYAMTAKGGGNFEVRLSFWLDPEGKPRRLVKETQHGDESYVETSTFGPIDLKAKHDAEVFKFSPPADWTTPPTWPDEILLAVGSPAPAVEGTGLDGKTVKLSDFKGQAVVLTFFEAGSAFCIDELGNLAKFHKAYSKRGVAFLAMSREDQPRTIERHFKANDLPLTAVLQKQYEISVAFNVRIQPATFLLDREGRVAARWVCIEEGELKEALEKVLK